MWKANELFCRYQFIVLGFSAVYRKFNENLVHVDLAKFLVNDETIKKTTRRNETKENKAFRTFSVVRTVSYTTTATEIS